jgi:Domain of unknown function (DUF4266)
MKKVPILKILIGLLMTIGIFSCTTVKEYQKNRINDSEMTLTNRKTEKTESSAELYKEGSSGANGGATGGGCGCN